MMCRFTRPVNSYCSLQGLDVLLGLFTSAETAILGG